MAALRDQLYVAWSEVSAGNVAILITKSQNGGDTFNTIERLSNNPGESRSPDLTTSENQIYLVWDVSPGGIFFIRSVDGGITFGAATMMITNGSDPALAVSQNIA